MGVLLVFLVVVGSLVTASATTSPPPPLESIAPCPPNGHSFLSILLQGLGYSDACVATALDTCATSQPESQLITLMKEIRDSVREVAQAVNKRQNQPRHCRDVLEAGDGQSGERVIYPYPGQPDRRLNVYCDQTTDGGGWTVVQRRTNSTVREDFYRTWSEYQLGFGNINTEFWYSGDAGDGLGEGGHPGSKFSTHDSDNDSYETSCAQKFRGAWWYNACHLSNLNGYQYVGNHTSYADGIDWRPWRGYHYSLRHTTMMIRPA
ncbi:techylectin-5A-like [Eriocheir sinensis]|uniref:techylectin-5A-like n=1 Tax=Eriocheir sinensis TaxID=95602 RepID=UPI0021C6501B|nr:techylectin-5A-like [Eriocheir sinensis]